MTESTVADRGQQRILRPSRIWCTTTYRCIRAYPQVCVCIRGGLYCAGKRLAHHQRYTPQQVSSTRSATRTRMACLQVSLLVAGIRKSVLVCITSRLEVVYFDNHGLLAVSISLSALSVCVTQAFVGSGSTYVYGYCDATYKDGMTKEETIEFVKNSEDTSSIS